MTKAPRDKKRAAYRRGFMAEYAAALLLLFKGYRIVAMRYRTRVGEIDIVARRGDLVVFVEVKARRSVTTGIDSVGFETQRRIRAASNQWLSRQADFSRLSCRYDIIVVTSLGFPHHLPDAF